MPYKNPAERAARLKQRYAEDPEFRQRILDKTTKHNDDKRRAAGAMKYEKHADMPPANTPEYATAYWALRRKRAVDAFGGACVVCGLDESDLLQIDHVNGDGRVDRKANNHYAILRSIEHGGTSGYQLLCPTCHLRKTRKNGEHKRR